jgi:hypothetical protein
MCATGRYARGEPHHHHDQHRRELHALGERADDQTASDAGERRLESGERIYWDIDALLNVAASGNVPLNGSKIPFMNTRLPPPMKALPSVKANE